MASKALDIGSRLELFVDYELIESLKGASLQLQKPQPAGAVLRFDAPWEGLFSGVITVIKDEDRYRMYYRGYPRVERGGDAADVQCTCYAESSDGLTFTKPDLGLAEWSGTRRNNVIMAGEGAGVVTHNFSPFLDTRPGVRGEERLKAIAGTHPHGLFVLASADGIHWRKLSDAPVITSQAFAFDSQNVAFWSQHEGCYVTYFRTWRKVNGRDMRWVSRATSEDFLHWSAHQEMDDGDAPVEEIYTQQTHPYFRAPHLYISLAARFWPDKQVVTDEQARQIGVHEEYYADCSDGVLMTSRGGNRYDRTFLESFLRPGPGYENWVSRTNYPGLGVVPTGPGEMSMYAHRHYGQPTSHVGRFTLRTDGFASVHAPYAGGELVTKPLAFSGSRLMINYATSAAGSILVEIQDAQGRPVPGYELGQCRQICGDEIERVVAWQGGSDVSPLAGQPIQLEFGMKDADLYSLRFLP